MVKLFRWLMGAVLVGAVGCASSSSTAVTASSASPQRHAAPRPQADDEWAALDASVVPNGNAPTCEVTPWGEGDEKAVVVIGGGGEFAILLPDAPDWKLECDDAHYFWAFSKAARLQVTVNPYQAHPGEELSAPKYLARVGENMKTGVQSHGIRVVSSSVWKVHEIEGREIWALEQVLDAPEGRQWPLFPQVSYWTSRVMQSGRVLDCHVTAYPKRGADVESLKSSMEPLLAAFATVEDMNKALEAQHRRDAAGSAPAGK